MFCYSIMAGKWQMLKLFTQFFFIALGKSRLILRHGQLICVKISSQITFGNEITQVDQNQLPSTNFSDLFSLFFICKIVLVLN